MFNPNILSNIKTVGAIILYQDTFAFMIGPDKTGEKLGIVRFGGHLEENETLFEALKENLKKSVQLKFN